MTSSLGTLTEVNQDGLPQVPPTNLPQLQHHPKARRIGIISMFDGVGSVYHIVKKELGGPPTVYIAAENDPVLRRLVCAEHGFKEEQQGCYTADGALTIYVRDVWKLIENDSVILRQAQAMYPNLKWFLVAGSPCRDLRFAGYLDGLLGLTGKRSMLLFIVYIGLCNLQCLFGFHRVRFLTENAGSMQPVQEIKRLNSSDEQLYKSQHFQMFL